MPFASRSFPDGFLWGTATSPHQVEGGNENNDWWEWEQRPGNIRDGTRSGRACGWWEGRAEEDLATAAALGQNSHRLGLEWSRIEPEPGKFDDAALDRYAALLAELRRLKLEPLVTLNHVSLPRWLAARGGWLSWTAVDHFAAYARVAVERLGAGARLWVTLNEPAALAGAAYGETYWPPALGSARAAMRALAIMMEAHAAARAAIRTAAPAAQVGIVLSAPWFEPATSQVLDRTVRWLQDWALTGAVIHGLQTGKLWPPLVGRRVCVPRLQGSVDFLGVNYYGEYEVRFDPRSGKRLFGRHVQDPTVRIGGCDWGRISPQGLTKQLLRLSRLGLPLYVTENGIEDAADARRAAFLRDHVAAIAAAIRLGADVRGYFHWSLVDNFEWAEGWAPRFGLVAVDRDTQARTLRPSAAVFEAICRSNGTPSPG